MKERPILFSGAMVRAILEGRKTQTRRVIRYQPFSPVSDVQFKDGIWTFYGDSPSQYDGVVSMNDWQTGFPCPYGVVGDRLWVKETWMAEWAGSQDAGDEYPVFGVLYRAGISGRRDGAGWEERPCPPVESSSWYNGWVPSIFMPRWASRITLEVTGVRVERLQEITNEDACEEGILPTATDHSVDQYADLWDSINGKKHPWVSNLWVWVIEFRRVAK